MAGCGGRGPPVQPVVVLFALTGPARAHDIVQIRLLPFQLTTSIPPPAPGAPSPPPPPLRRRPLSAELGDAYNNAWAFARGRERAILSESQAHLERWINFDFEFLECSGWTRSLTAALWDFSFKRQNRQTYHSGS